MNRPTDTKSFSRRVAEGMFWSSSAAITMKVLGAVSTFLILGHLTLHEYGTYQLALSAYLLLSTFLFSGIDQVVIAHGARLLGARDETASRNTGLAFAVLMAAIGAVLWAVAFFAQRLFAEWYSGDILGLLRIVAWIFLLVPFQRLVAYDLSVRQRFFTLNLFSLLEEALKTAGLVIAFYVVGARIEGVLWAMVLSSTAALCLFFPLIAPSYAPSLRHLRFGPLLALVVNQGKWIIGQKALRQGEKSLRPFLIQFFVGREAVALFSVAEKLMTYVMTIAPTNAVLVPALSVEAANRERLQRVMERGIKYSVPAYTVAALAAGVFGPPFIAWFFPAYVPALPYFFVLLAYVPFTGVAQILTSFFFSEHEQRSLFVSVLVRFFIFALLAPTLLFLFGLYGIVFEYVLTLVSFNAIRYTSLVRGHPELRIRFRNLFTVDSYDREVWRRVWHRLTRGS